MNELENSGEITAMKQNKEKRMKTNENSLRDLWDNVKSTNIYIIGVLEGEERERVSENIWIDNSQKLLYHEKRNTHSSPGSTECHTG